MLLADPSFGNLVVRDFLFQSIWKDIALVIEQRQGGPIPAKLSVKESDASVLATQDALRSFMQQGGFILEVNPDEF